MFNLQLFGNNDTVTSGRDLKLVYQFADNDTRTVTMPNSKTNLTAENIANCAATLAATQAFVGDKTGADFVTISSAEIVEYTRRDLDLT